MYKKRQVAITYSFSAFQGSKTGIQQEKIFTGCIPEISLPYSPEIQNVK
jgi:hypothetical protein